MGKQVNFYMTDSDEEDFFSFTRSDRDAVIILDGMTSEDYPCFTDMPEREAPFSYSVWLWDRDHSPTPILTEIPKHHFFLVDRFGSEVIQLSRCSVEEKCLVRGRIWAEMAMWESDGTLVRKSKTFEKWYDRLARWIRSHSVRYDKGVYVMPGAAEFEKQGGRLVEGL